MSALEYTGGTIFSRRREFRYTLERFWSETPGVLVEEEPDFIPEEGWATRPLCFAQFVGLNPSTADEIWNDPTVSRCIAYARAWGFGGMVMTNIHAFRSTDPAALYRSDDPTGPDNMAWIEAVGRKAGVIVCAWGNHGEYLGRGAHVADHLARLFPEKLCTLASAAGVPLLNKTGHPVHPLYQRAECGFAKWGGLKR